MAVQTAVDVLARMLDGYESGERSVRHVGATSPGRGDALEVELEVPVPLCGDGEPEALGTPLEATLSDDGALVVEFPTDVFTEFPSTPEADVTASTRSARVCDGEVLLWVEATITPTDDVDRTRTDDGGVGGDATQLPQDAAPARVAGGVDHDGEEPDVGNEATAGSGSAVPSDTASRIEAARDESVPPYDDVEYLRAIYEQFDTFSEMRETFEMDVSTETVRRYMIDAGIHDPTSYETAAGAAAGSLPGRDAGDGDAVEPSSTGERGAPAGSIPDEQLVTDGIGLPDDLTLEDVLDAVVESSTVYEVTRTLQLDQRRTREILEHLDLLNLVMHRVSDDDDRDVTYEEVAERLRQTAASA